MFNGQETQGSVDLTLRDGDRFVVVSDSQVPFEDKNLLDSIFTDFVPFYRPRGHNYHLFLAGDILDNFSLSKFPPRVTAKFTLEDEINLTKTYLAKWATKFTHKHFIFGNHEDRYDREIYAGNKEFAPYTQSLAEALELTRLGYTHVPYLRHIAVNGFVITHGDIVRENTASAMLSTYSASGASGHVNRPHSFTRADARDGNPNTWFCLGMTCITNIGDYIKDWRRIQPWQQSFGIGEVHNGKVHFQLIRVHHGSYLAAGRIFDI